MVARKREESLDVDPRAREPARLSPTEQATVERILRKAGRGERLSAADKDQLRTIVARHFPKAADYQWRNVVRLALALVGPIEPDAGHA